MSRIAAILVACLLFVPVVLGLHSERTKSWTWDEPIYLAGGHYLLETRNFRNQAISYHPPLAFYWNSLGLIGLDLPDAFFPQATVDHDWEVGMQVAFRSGHDPNIIKTRARLPFLLLAPLLGWFVFSWSRDLWGVGGGLLSLFLVAFDPNLIAHSRLVATDYIFTVTLVGTLFFSRRLLKRGQTRDVLFSGVGLGLAVLAKFTAIILGPIFLLGTWWAVSRKPPSGWRSWDGRWVVAGFAVVMCLAFLVLWAGYLFQFDVALSNPEERAAVAAMPPQSGIAGLYQSLYQSELPLPAVSYFMGFFSQYAHGSGGHSNYLLGEVQDAGWVTYFPIALAVKTPIPILLAWSAGLFCCLRSGTSRRELLWCIAAPVILLALSTRSNINIGVRHALIVYPLMAVVSGAIIKMLSRPPVVIGAVLCAIWLAVSTVLIHPHYLTYFNALAGGPANGHRILVDSNLDWGQDLEALIQRAEEQGWSPLRIQYFGPPRRLELVSTQVSALEAPCSPMEGYVAVSMTNRVGAYMPEGAACFSWLDGYEPLDVVHNTIAVYHVPGELHAK